MMLSPALSTETTGLTEAQTAPDRTIGTAAESISSQICGLERQTVQQDQLIPLDKNCWLRCHFHIFITKAVPVNFI